MASTPTLADPTAPTLPVRPGKLADLRHHVLESLLSLHAEFGEIAAIQDGANRVIFLFDPVYNRQVLSDVAAFDTRFFSIRGPKRSSQRRLTCGLLGMNGEQWKRNRRLVKEPFSLRQIATYTTAIRDLAEQRYAMWPEAGPVDMNLEMTRFMLQVTSSILFGLDETALAYEVGEQIAEWVTMNHQLGIGALVPDDKFSAGYEHLLEFAEGLERQVMEMITRRRDGDENANDVLSILVRTHDEQGGLSNEELVGQACVLFGAAHLTTSHSLTWTLMLLAQHPSVMKRLKAELDAAPATASDEPDPNSLLERVIRESMRMLPASSYSVRLPNHGVDIGPFKEVPRGTPIVFSPLVTHRLEKTFPNPKRFDPDRWLTIKPTAYEYLPFGAGPRMCIGGPLAMQTIRTALPIFLRKRMEVIAGSPINAEIESTMLNPVSGLPMTIGPHDGTFRANPVTGNISTLVDMAEAPAA